MKFFAVFILVLLLFFEGRAVFYNKSYWPFHSMNMFVDDSTGLIYELKIKVVKLGQIEENAELKHLYPFGPWRFRVASYRHFKKGRSDLDLFLKKFFQFSRLQRPKIYETIYGIRLYQCSKDKNCVLLGEGS